MAREGLFKTGLHDETFLCAVGQIVTGFTLLENGMVDLMADLMGGDDPPARQVFFSLTSQSARVKILTAMLEESSINKDKDSSYDEMINDYRKLSSARNKYVHGLWWEHESGEKYLAELNEVDWSWHEGRRIELKELSSTIENIYSLLGRLQPIWTNRVRIRSDRLQALHGRLAPPPHGGNASTPPETTNEESLPPPQSSPE